MSSDAPLLSSPAADRGQQRPHRVWLLERLTTSDRQPLQAGQRGQPADQLPHVDQPAGIRRPGVLGGAARGSRWYSPAPRSRPGRPGRAW